MYIIYYCVSRWNTMSVYSVYTRTHNCIVFVVVAPTHARAAARISSNIDRRPVPSPPRLRWGGRAQPSSSSRTLARARACANAHRQETAAAASPQRPESTSTAVRRETGHAVLCPRASKVAVCGRVLFE